MEYWGLIGLFLRASEKAGGGAWCEACCDFFSTYTGGVNEVQFTREGALGLGLLSLVLLFPLNSLTFLKFICTALVKAAKQANGWRTSPS